MKLKKQQPIIILMNTTDLTKLLSGKKTKQNIGVDLEGRFITVEFLKDGERLPGRDNTPREAVPIVKKTIRKDDNNNNNNRLNNS